MIIGNTNSFAVAYELDENQEGTWLFGKFCYWIDGSQVGNYDLGTSLRDVLFQMKYVVSDCGNRHGEALCKLPPVEAFYRLDAALYEGSVALEFPLVGIPLPDTPARFEIKISVDVFDQWKIYILECEDRATILYKKLDDTDVMVSEIDIGIFDNVIKKVQIDLTVLYDANQEHVEI